MKTKHVYIFLISLLILIVYISCKKENDEKLNDDFVCGVSSVIDYDGNAYKTVLIGNQCWMSENLKTTHYSNGTPIEYPGDNDKAWQNNTEGALAWQYNDLAWGEKYGALYNWYAVNNSGKLCPEGWQVPSDNQWLQLRNFVISQGFYDDNYQTVMGAGNALKSCRQFMSPLGEECNVSGHPRWNQGHHYGFDEFGFSALPGGARGANGYFNPGVSGFWWTSSDFSTSNAWFYYLDSNTGEVRRSNFNKNLGFSVRCVKQ